VHALSFFNRDVAVEVAELGTQVKRLLTGSGNASKEQIQHAIRHELGLDKVLEPNDVADAFAVALCHYHCSRVASISDASRESLR
jgi:crossover junction endodeoxyribonuclease RuvC